MKIGSISILIAAAASLLLSAGSARGGFLLTDSNKLPASSTTANFFFNNVSPPRVINANVEAAVYSKTGFESSFGSHPEINSSDFVYVYQIFDNGTTPNPTTQALSFLSVGIIAGMAPYDISHTNKGDGSLIAPATSALTADLSSAKWSYTSSPFLAVNATSEYLYFASPFGFGSASASVAASGIIGTFSGTLPSPVPEPGAALILGIVAAAGALGRRRF